MESFPGVRDSPIYPTLLPSMVRAALQIGEPELAERLVGSLAPRYPLAEHALVAAHAALTEARGDLQAAADAYVDAADRRERSGSWLSRRSRSSAKVGVSVGLSRPTEAAPVLQHAREIFERLGATPALDETDALLQQATALTSQRMER